MKVSATSQETGQLANDDDRKAILLELEEILSSPHFRNSKRYPALLRFCVENTLVGHADRLKERNLGVEVFDRRPDYDTNADTVVRYTAGEVRKRLQLYYHEPGHGFRVQISLPAGSYVPDFCFVSEGQQESHSELEHLQPTSSSLESLGGIASAVELQTVEGSDNSAVARQDTSASGYHVGRLPGRSSKPLWMALALCVVLIAGCWMWLRPAHQTAMDRFWSPLLHTPKSVLLCTGGSVFAPNHFSGVATANKDTEYPFVSMQSATAIAHLSAALERSGAAYDLKASATTSLLEMRERPLILLGGYNNDWTLRLLAPLRFHFAPEPSISIVDRDHPGIHWERDPSRAYSAADDFAIIARFHDPNTDSMVLVLAGLGRNGTEGAAQFVTDPHYLQELSDRVGSNLSSRNMEVVIKNSVIDGKTGAPSIQAVYVW